MLRLWLLLPLQSCSLARQVDKEHVGNIYSSAKEPIYMDVNTSVWYARAQVITQNIWLYRSDSTWKNELFLSQKSQRIMWIQTLMMLCVLRWKPQVGKVSGSIHSVVAFLPARRNIRMDRNCCQQQILTSSPRQPPAVHFPFLCVTTPPFLYFSFESIDAHIRVVSIWNASKLVERKSKSIPAPRHRPPFDVSWTRWLTGAWYGHHFRP